ncbi:MAG TPA: hypothetical protein VL727_08010 [Puia sp.]|jgi:hypothetical protein|nr:hypothetical protein [Puia sp.]
MIVKHWTKTGKNKYNVKFEFIDFAVTVLPGGAGFLYLVAFASKLELRRSCFATLRLARKVRFAPLRFQTQKTPDYRRGRLCPEQESQNIDCQ